MSEYIYIYVYIIQKNHPIIVCSRNGRINYNDIVRFDCHIKMTWAIWTPISYGHQSNALNQRDGMESVGWISLEEIKSKSQRAILFSK